MKLEPNLTNGLTKPPVVDTLQLRGIDTLRFVIPFLKVYIALTAPFTQAPVGAVRKPHHTCQFKKKPHHGIVGWVERIPSKPEKQ